jgi:hypothetical protein
MPNTNVNAVVAALTELYDLDTQAVLVLHTMMYQLYNSANGYTLDDLYERFSTMFARVQDTALITNNIQVAQTLN